MTERAVGIELFKQASGRFARGELAVALRLAGRARDVLTSTGDVDAACAAVSLEGRIHLRAGRQADALACFEQAREDAARRHLEARELSAMTEIGSVHELRGDLAAAVALHREVLARQRKRDDNLGIAVAAGNVGRLLQRLAPGRAREAEETDDTEPDARTLLHEAMDRFETAGHAAGMANALICLGDLERASGDLDAAQAAFSQVAHATEGRLEPLHAVAQLNLGHLLRDRGDVDGAVAAFSQSFALATRIGDEQGIARAALALAMARADTAPLAETAAAFAQVEARFRKLGLPAGEQTASVNRAAILCRMAQLREGRALLERARHRLRDQGDRLGVLEVGLALAEVHLTLGEAAAAEAELAVTPASSCPGRLALRRNLLEIRIHLRQLHLQAAGDLLANLPRESLSQAERFAIGLVEAELGGWRGDPGSEALLDEVMEQADGASPREAAAVRSGQASLAYLRGNLPAARVFAADAVERWWACAEPLPVVHALVLQARIDALDGLAVSQDALLQHMARMRDCGATDAALAIELLAAALRLQAGDSQARQRVEAAVAALRQLGNELAAAWGLALAARLTGDPAWRASVEATLASKGAALPGWWQQQH
jgi:tetratricopeptide (TPR) repeat protein